MGWKMYDSVMGEEMLICFANGCIELSSFWPDVKVIKDAIRLTLYVVMEDVRICITEINVWYILLYDRTW